MFLRARAARLLRPSLAFLMVWVAFGRVAHLAGLDRGPDGGFVREALVRVPQLLWFIGIYLGVCACAPPLLRPHRRWGLWVVVALVGLPGEAVSNTGPPTAALLAQGIGMAGLAVLLRPAMARVLARRRVWLGVVMAAPFAMTAFLWHLTAPMIVLLSLHWLGIDQPPVASAAWWATRPVLFPVLAFVTAGLVAVFVRFDRGPRAPAAPPGQRRWADAVAAGSAPVIVLGTLMVSVVGVDVLGNRGVFFVLGDLTPAAALAVIGLGLGLLALTRPPGRLRPSEPAPEARGRRSIP